MNRTWEDGVLDTLEQLEKTDQHVHSRVAMVMLCPAVYRRAKRTGRLTATGISRVSRESARDPMSLYVHPGNSTRH